MRKSRIIYLLVTGMVLFGLAGGAWAYTFTDATTDVQPWLGTSVYGSGTWTDVIGTQSVFDTVGANLSGKTLTIFTNWNPTTDDGYVSPLVKTADLFIYTGGNTYAIRLDTTGKGLVYLNPTINTSKIIFAPTGLVYGGLYNQNSPADVPTWATSPSTGTTNVSWGTGGGYNTVTVDLSSIIADSAAWSFVWGTATCSNDAFYGSESAQVPEPGIMLLIGIGLVGLAGLKWKFKN